MSGGFLGLRARLGRALVSWGLGGSGTAPPPPTLHVDCPVIHTLVAQNPTPSTLCAQNPTLTTKVC